MRAMLNGWMLAVGLALAVLAGTAGCSEDVDPGQGPACDEGFAYNPISARCEPATSGNNRLPPPADTGVGGPPDAPPPAPDTGPGPGPGPGPGDECEAFTRGCVDASTTEVCINGRLERHACPEGQTCEHGYCESSGCYEGAIRCTSRNEFQVCDGGEYGEPVACEGGKACVAGQCVGGCSVNLKERSNLGCDYISVRHDIITPPMTQPVNHSVVVSNPGDTIANLIVTSPEMPELSFPNTTVAPMSSLVLDFPASMVVSQPGVSRRIFRIASDQPVIATQFAPLNNPGARRETSDATLLLPVNALGQEYVTLGWRDLNPRGAYVDIVAPSAGTTVVSVTSPIKLSAGSAGQVAAGGTTEFVIHRDQVLHLVEDQGAGATQPQRDVSGIVITATQPIAVYTGARIVNIPDVGDRLQAGDHIEHQMFPVDAWGTRYIGAPFKSRVARDFSIYRVIASEDATTVQFSPAIDGHSQVTLARGQFHEFRSSQPFEVSADKPIQLGQYMIGGEIEPRNGDGDPSFVLPSAVEQYRDEYVFLVPAGYRRNHIAITAPVDAQITLDGQIVPESSFQTFGTGQWKYAVVDTRSGVHTASSSQPFGMLVHGYDYYISYAFAAGIILPE